MKNQRRCKCRHCKEFYRKDPRNRWHQIYCQKPECRKASKVESQRRWLQKPGNQNYFRGAENVQRVQQWRKKHPEYWRRPRGKTFNALQDVLISEPIDIQEVKRSFVEDALQDVLFVQPPLVVGLISMITGHALQENIEQTIRSLLSKGQQILDMKSGIKTQGDVDENQTCASSGSIAQSAASIQLAGSAIDPG